MYAESRYPPLPSPSSASSFCCAALVAIPLPGCTGSRNLCLKEMATPALVRWVHSESPCAAISAVKYSDSHSKVVRVYINEPGMLPS